MTLWIGGFYATSTPYMSETAANNNYAAPNGAPEGMVGNTVDNWGRELMKDIARWNADMDLVATHNSGNVLEVTTTRGEQYIGTGACYGIRIAGTALTANDPVYLRVNGISPDRQITLGNGTTGVKGRDLPVGSKIIVAFNGGFCVVNSNVTNPEWETAYSNLNYYPVPTCVYSMFQIGPIQCTVWRGQLADTPGEQYISVSGSYSAPTVGGGLIQWIHSGSYWLSPNMYTSGNYAYNKNLMTLSPYFAQFCSLVWGYNV